MFFVDSQKHLKNKNHNIHDYMLHIQHISPYIVVLLIFIFLYPYNVSGVTLSPADEAARFPTHYIPVVSSNETLNKKTAHKS